MNSLFAKVLSSAAIVITLAAFLFSCMIIPTDAQGAFIFIFTLPVMVLSSIIGYFVAKKNNLDVLKVLNSAAIILVGLFFVSAFVPGLHFFSDGIINGSTKAFTAFMGETPKKYFSRRNNMYQLIQDELDKTQRQKIDFTKIDSRYDWNRLCFFDNNSKQAAVDSSVGQSFDLKMYNPYKDDPTHRQVLIFIENKSTSYYTWYKPSELDFTKYIGQCIERSKAVFNRENPDLNVYVLE